METNGLVLSLPYSNKCNGPDASHLGVYRDDDSFARNKKLITAMEVPWSHSRKSGYGLASVSK